MLEPCRRTVWKARAATLAAGRVIEGQYTRNQTAPIHAMHATAGGAAMGLVKCPICLPRGNFPPVAAFKALHRQATPSAGPAQNADLVCRTASFGVSSKRLSPLISTLAAE